MKTLPLLLLLSGCPSGSTTPLPGQAEAVQFIWELYGSTKDAPAIYWRFDSCNAPNGIYGTLPWCTFDDGGVEVAGIESENDTWVEVGAPSDGFKISDTALAHELLHAAIGDTYHHNKVWEWLPDRANNELKARGL